MPPIFPGSRRGRKTATCRYLGIFTATGTDHQPPARDGQTPHVVGHARGVQPADARGAFSGECLNIVGPAA